MAYIAVRDMRSATLAEFASQLALTTTDASDANLNAAIVGVGERIDGWTEDHFEAEPTNETQTLDFGDIGSADTFKLTWGGNESALVTYSADMASDIDAALAGLAGIADAGTDTTVTKVTTSLYTVEFTGLLATTDVGAISITSQSGFTATGVTETIKGVSTQTLELDGDGTGRLYLPRRCTAVASVKLRDEEGTLGSAEDTDAYRLHSSLNSAGSRRVGDLDYIDVVPDGAGLTEAPDGAYHWPKGPQTVQVIGTFGWTVTPRDIKRAAALLVYDHFKPLAKDLRRTERYQAAEVAYNLAQTTPSGIPEVDAIVAEYRRETGVGIA